MASFQAKAVGGPDDGLIIDTIIAPQDGKQISQLPEARRQSNVQKVYATYQFDQPHMRWLFVGYTKQRISGATQ